MMWSLIVLPGILAITTFSMTVDSCDNKDFFGAGCKFKCHCRAAVGDQSKTWCDVDGECLNGARCEPGWFGPACQYVDMTRDSTVVTLKYGAEVSKLTDGDDQSCLSISIFRFINLTWTQPFVFRWLRVHVHNASVVHGFTVRFRTNDSQQPIDCSNPRNATVNGSSLDIYCDLKVPVRTILLEGPGVAALCSVYVSGGRNVALLGNATQSSNFYDYGANKAVDGDRKSVFNQGSCSHTDIEQTSATWNISFSQPQLINRVQIFNRIDTLRERLQGFILTASSSDNKKFPYEDTTSEPQNVYKLPFSANNTPISQLGIQAMYAYTGSYYILTLCEVEIYGDTVCPEGRFGRECEHTCKCSGPCFVSTGGCPYGCPAGYHGEDCLSTCPHGYFGPNCAEACSQHCGGDGDCLARDGSCAYGCQAGYANPTCNDTCGYQLFGLECSSNCSFMCVNDGGRLCEPISGKCLAGCRSDYSGSDCQVVPGAGSHQGSSSLAGPAIGAAAAAFLLAVVAATALICWRRRRYSKPAGRLMAASNDNMANSSPDVMMQEFPMDKMSQVGKSGNTPGIPHFSTGDYYNFTPASVADSDTRISVQELDTFMSTHDHSFFREQFACIPRNEEATMLVGQSSENKNKNRYKNICAYDHSRVHLKGSKHKKHGDYINASYVEGYKGEELFIASQGPTKAILGDFVQMLWEQEVDKVVMLTNLVEEGKHKCERYWPEDGEIKLGEVTVKLATTQVFADYTIRILQLSTKGGQVQTVTHFHFTSWPDKDVPTAPWGLVDFEQRVASYPTRKPVVVHCSAGVGRTGTFIALRNVMRQAEDTGYVDVFTTVTMLRRSRVNMVQTADQYEFLHRSAQVAILCMDTTVTSSDVRDRIHNLSLTTDTGSSNMEKEFQAVCNICNLDDKLEDHNGTSPDDPYMVYQNSLAVTNLPKNRFSNILPKEYYRVILQSGGRGSGDYINAVFVPSFTKLNQHILSQLPLPTTVIDLWRLVIQYKVSLIVAFEADLGMTDKTVATYLPQAENDVISFEQFNIRTEQVITEKFWQKQEVVITGSTRRSRRKSTVRVDRDMYVTHLQCTNTDLEPGNLLSVVKQVRSLAQAGKYKILYMCRNGADYSGLACILSLLLDRMDSDQRLTIPLVVGAIKAIRPQVIPTLTQYRLLYDVLSMYIDSVNVYSNF